MIVLKLFGFPIFRFWAYLVEVFIIKRKNIWHLRFYYI